MVDGNEAGARTNRFRLAQAVLVVRGRQPGVVAGAPRDTGHYPVAVFRDKRPSLRWVPGPELQGRDGRPKDEPLQNFVRSARCQAAVAAPPPSAYRVSPRTLSRNEAAGALPGWTAGRARIVTGRTDHAPEEKRKRLSKNARKRVKRELKRFAS